MTTGVLPETVEVARDLAPPDPCRALRLPADHARVVAETGRAALAWFALVVVYGSQRPLSLSGLVPITLAAAIWLVALRSSSTPGCLVFGRVLVGGLGAGIGLAVVAALNGSPVGLHLSWPWLVGSALGVMASALVWDWFVDRTLAARRRVLLVGTDAVGAMLAEELRRCRHGRFDVVGSASPPVRDGLDSAGIGGIDELAGIVESQRPDFVVLTDEEHYGDVVDRLLDSRANVRVASVSSFFEYALGRVPIEHVTPAWFMGLVHPRQHVYSRLSKRTFDVLVAALGLALAAPVLAVLALLAKTTPGPVLYRQTRIGEGGRTFTLYKLRTMQCEAEPDGAAFADWDDPRATRIGRALRRRHLDELPQLWNVLKGDMSIVGPRPERPELIEMIEAAVPFWSRRLLVQPGITGWAQVRDDYASDCDGMARKLSYDLWYLRHRSLTVDLAVCALTFYAVLARPLRG